MQHATLALESLASIPALPRGAHIALLQKCCVCFDNQGFASGFFLLVECKGLVASQEETETFFKLTWQETVDDALRGAHADLSESVEDSAKAIGMLLISALTQYKTCRQALRGTHIDYYLVDSNAELPFQSQNTACVEFTGILNDLDGITQRIKEKRKRLYDKRDFPVYIVCVEHNFPVARIERVEP